MSIFVGWTFMSTMPKHQLPENGKKYFFHSRQINLFTVCLQTRHLPGGHKCPPYGGSDELF